MSLCLVANWKLNGSKEFNHQWALEFLRNFNGNNFSILGIAPASLYIDHLKTILTDYDIEIGSQNIDLEETGARTGEISASMIKDLGCAFSIIGHSERRMLFHETNQMICQKLIQADNNSVIPILCIGESAEENQSNNTFNVLEQQIIEALENANELSALIIAYEPVWAIGSGNTPKPEEINSVHEMIKDVVQSRFPKIGLESVLYGGSVNFKNASSLFEQKNVDGALIGGASLDGREFALIANVFNELRV
ncbi:triose-phosphate isomerase [Pseudomonadota bacterium]|nr:triose-phosphate isomerase [Pseudomonadota bacterium]